MTPVLRRGTAADLPAMSVTDGRSFGFHYTDQDIEDLRTIIDPTRFVLACEQDAIVGLAGSYGFDVTPPGGAPIPVEGVTWVGVLATHRRRGVLRSMITELHRGYVEAGVPLAVLTASEATIYGRFGYGVATVHRWAEIDRKQVTFRDGVPDPGGVRYADPDEAREHAPDVHRRWCAHHPGAVSRNQAWWEFTLRDREHQRRGASALFHLLHPDGYAAYRIHRDTAQVVDFFALTDEAHVALWRLLLGLDLIDKVTTNAVPADDPLPWLLTDARAVHTVDGMPDGMWARVLDVPAVLAARRYAVEVDVVLDVPDPDLDRGGRFRLTGGPDGATCTPTADAPDLHVDIRALGSLTFGGPRAGTLARAGLIHAADDAVLRRFDAACTADREPLHGTRF